VNILVISQPKAGTYLCANILVELGFVFNGLHIGKKTYQRYDLNNLQDSRLNPEKYTRKSKLLHTLNKLKKDEIALSHLPYKNKIRHDIKDFKKIYLYRDYNERLNSWNRWIEKTGRKDIFPNSMTKEYSELMNNWTNEPNTFTLSFDDMRNKNFDKINQLQNFFFEKIKFDSKFIIHRSLKNPSLTKI